MADNNTIETIKAVGAVIGLLTPVALAWILYKQTLLSKKQDEIRKDVDGKMTQLLEVTGAKERAEGKLEEKADQKAATEKPLDVNIVDQTKPVEITQIKPK